MTYRLCSPASGLLSESCTGAIKRSSSTKATTLSAHTVDFEPSQGTPILCGFVYIIPLDLNLGRRRFTVHEKNAWRYLRIFAISQFNKYKQPAFSLCRKPAYKPVLVDKGDTWNNLRARIVDTRVADYFDAFQGAAL